MSRTTSGIGYSQEHYSIRPDGYSQYTALPIGILERQLQEAALGDCTGMTVLDLGGGDGVRARHAVDLGATAVDVVDISPKMMKFGQQIEESVGRGTKILQYFEADISRPKDMARLPLRYKAQGYDVVMANWVFQHAASDEQLDRMMQSCVAYLKPGGRFISARLVHNGPTVPAFREGKYGVSYHSHEFGAVGGLFRLRIHVDPPYDFHGTSLTPVADEDGMGEFHSRYGLENTQVEPLESASWIKSDPAYWKLLTDEPGFAVVKATKML